MPSFRYVVRRVRCVKKQKLCAANNEDTLPIKGTGIKVKIIGENVSKNVIQMAMAIQTAARPFILLDLSVILYKHNNLRVCVVKVKMCCTK